MLVLTRRNGEAVNVGNHVQVRVLEVRGSQVRLGIEAPRAVAVDRKEIRERKNTAGSMNANKYPME